MRESIGSVPLCPFFDEEEEEEEEEEGCAGVFVLFALWILMRREKGRRNLQ
jgi:hypothetical protein